MPAKRVLLISPEFNPEMSRTQTLSSRSKAARLFPLQVGYLPLGLATIAALTPDEIEVDIWDEGVMPPISEHTELEKSYDLVGMTGYGNHAGRVLELGEIFRRRGVLTAVGGPGVSAEPERFRDHLDILFVGEAEYTWPRFVAEWSAGHHRAEYRQVGKVDMADSPIPRWDTVATGSYLVGTVQTTRGCPFDCEFCDVIYIFGRQARHKSVDQVLEEISVLERQGVEHIFFCDDNFIGNRKYAKDLVRALIPLNRSFRRPLAFFAQLTLNVARDDEMLALMAEAPFLGIFIGIESPNVESLIEINKPQNYRTDIAADLGKIHGFGIVVRSGMIVGFDHDDGTIFDAHFDFLQETGILVPMVNVLKAPTGTKLWTRLHREGRVLDVEELHRAANVECQTNVIPKQMTMAELLSGYLDLLERLRDWGNFEFRVKRFLSQVRYRPEAKGHLNWKELVVFGRLFGEMDRAAQRSTLRLLYYALKKSPFMTKRVMGAVAHQYQEAQRVPKLKKKLGEQIRRLTSGELQFEREKTVFFVPDGFKKPYEALFPELYECVYRGLTDKSRTQNALVEVTYDFLTRWGLSFHRFEEHHRTFFFEICDRTIASENSGSWDEVDGHGGARERDDDRAAPGARRSSRWLKRLADDVLRCVEQDLRTFATPHVRPLPRRRQAEPPQALRPAAVAPGKGAIGVAEAGA